MQIHFDPDKVQQILQQKKFAKNWTGFRPKESHWGLLVGTAIVFDADEVSIPGMTLQIELRVPTLVDDCLIILSVFQRAGSVRHRAYQLEVCPVDKLSHNGESPIYGPHVHLPNGEVHPVRDAGVDCANWDGVLAWFLSHTKIERFDLDQPC